MICLCLQYEWILDKIKTKTCPAEIPRTSRRWGGIDAVNTCNMHLYAFWFHALCRSCSCEPRWFLSVLQGGFKYFKHWLLSLSSARVETLWFRHRVSQYPSGFANLLYFLSNSYFRHFSWLNAGLPKHSRTNRRTWIWWCPQIAEDLIQLEQSGMKSNQVSPPFQ